MSPHIAVGGRVPPEGISELVRAAIRHVVDLRSEAGDDESTLRRYGIGLLRLPTIDARAPTQAMLREGVEWVRSRTAKNESVLIHCEYGIGRAPLLTCCVLVSAGIAPLDAIARVKNARAQASPSPEQLAALVEWSSAWREKNRLTWSIPTVDALGRIAYRHLASY